MRNLKKILAMVLALVMSLSLMATAGAADFTDADSINDTYQVAVEVLEGLGVFKGYNENGSYSFKPQGDITRAETAAIIYRIVTGDVEDKQVSIYRDYGIFTDVPSDAWYAGYVNFCANAEYIKGVGNGKFEPSKKVEGYAALAMILRAIGYTANGGFTGSDWRVQTARVGEARQITKNISATTLRSDATREVVAEILFQAILAEMVDHNVLYTNNGNQGYYIPENSQTLGYKTFGLEEVIGVVVANEYANLDSNRVLPNGRTNVRVGDETWKLNYGTEITDIGEARRVFTTYQTGVVGMYDNDEGVVLNKVTETGAAVDIGSASKFAATAEMPAAADIEYYTNFEPNIAGHYYCDQRLEFSVVFYGAQAEAAFDGYKGINISKIAADDSEWIVDNVGGTESNPTYTKVALNGASDYGVGAGNDPAYTYPVRYTKIIWAGMDITDTDLLVLESIFGTADNKNNNNMDTKRITGDVFVGTKSTNAEATNEERDLSNQISYKKFFEDYIIANSDTNNWSVTWNGWWTKFIDNDRDGAADYAFRTNYELAEALYTYTDRDGNTYLEFSNFDNENLTVRYMVDGYTPNIGDKVLAALIDGQWLVEPANDETVVVSSYSWRNDEITTDKGTYGQSGIINATDMLEQISAMEDKVTYIVYFDHFGYVRAYELPGGTKYALITEMYYTNSNQGNVIDKWPMTAELTTLDDEGKTVTDEYNVVSGAGTFTAVQPWMRVDNAVATYNYNNWLQPAIAHLGVTRDGYAPTKGTPTFVVTPGSADDYMIGGAYVTFWDTNRQLVRDLTSMTGCQEFNYGAQNFRYLYDAYHWNVAATASFTNVAAVNIEGSNASLYGAASLAFEKNGTVKAAPNAYATDYIQLATSNVAAQAVRYEIYDGPDSYKSNNNNWVNAVHDTQYFIAYNGGVYSFTDYVNFPGLTNAVNQIHAAYAVARNVNSDAAGYPYWVADVIVYEIYAPTDVVEQTSVSLAFYTPTRTSGNVQEIETLNSKYGPEVTLVPKSLAWSADRGQWGAQWDGYGFYALYNDSEPVDNVMEARTISKIGIGDYAKNGIYAGTIVREAYIDGAGEYIDVDMGGGKIASVEITNKIYSVTRGTAQSDWWYGYNVATLLRYENQANSQVRKGDSVIWVGTGRTNGTRNGTSFVVDLGSSKDWSRDTTAYCGEDLLNGTASFLIDTYQNANGYRYVKGLDDAAGYTYADNDSGVWQQIMKEQNAPAPAADTVTITVKYEPDASCTTDQKNAFTDRDIGDYTYTVPVGVSQVIAGTEGFLKISGWDLYQMGVKDTDDATVIKAFDTTTNVTIAGSDVDEDLTITVAYKPTVTSFKADTLGSTPAGSTFKYKLSTDAAWRTDATTAVNTLHDGSTAIPYGASWELKLTPNALYDYTASVSAGTGTITNANPSTNDDGDLVWTGTITGQTVVTVVETPKTNLVTIALTADQTTECEVTGIDDGDSVVAGSEIKFQVAAETGYVIDKVTYTVIGGTASGTLTENADGDYVIPATATTPANATVSITVECISTDAATFTLKSDGTNKTDAAIIYTVKDRAGTLVASGIIAAEDETGADVTVQAGYTITLTSSALFKAKSSSVCNTDLGTAADAESTGTYTLVLTVTNASANATITLGDSSLT